MNRRSMQLVFVCLLLVNSSAFAQSQDVPKYEIAGEFTTLERDNFGGKKAEPGVGARFTYNLNEIFAFEAAGYLYPEKCSSCGGRMSQFVAGVKVGKRFGKWGIFAKARPGLVSLSRAEINLVGINPPGSAVPIEVEVNRITNFAVDVGGVVEYYPSRRFVTRFDVGDTIVHFRSRTTNFLGFDFPSNSATLIPVFRPARTTHNFQFIASFGYRF
jgi:Outer membrane protein beta-barrel domain